MEKGDNDGSEDINGISSNTDQPCLHNFIDDFNYHLIYAAHGIDVWLRLELRKFFSVATAFPLKSFNDGNFGKDSISIFKCDFFIAEN